MPRAKRLADLTDREREVLDLIRVGLTNEEIAERLGITLAGAKYHVSEILTKLGVASREEATAWQSPESSTPMVAPRPRPLAGVEGRRRCIDRCDGGKHRRPGVGRGEYG